MSKVAPQPKNFFGQKSPYRQKKCLLVVQKVLALVAIYGGEVGAPFSVYLDALLMQGVGGAGSVHK
jgi:hypothetical protein